MRGAATTAILSIAEERPHGRRRHAATALRATWGSGRIRCRSSSTATRACFLLASRLRLASPCCATRANFSAPCLVPAMKKILVLVGIVVVIVVLVIVGAKQATRKGTKVYEEDAHKVD